MIFIDPKTGRKFEAQRVQVRAERGEKIHDMGWLVPVWVTSLPESWMSVDKSGSK